MAPDGLEEWCARAAELATSCPLPEACEVLLLATFATALQVTKVRSHAGEGENKYATLLDMLLYVRREDCAANG